MTITLQHALFPVCLFIPVKSKICTNYELRIGVELWGFFHKEGKTRFINIIHISQNRLPWGRNVYGHLKALVSSFIVNSPSKVSFNCSGIFFNPDMSSLSMVFSKGMQLWLAWLLCRCLAVKWDFCGYFAFERPLGTIIWRLGDMVSGQL